MTQIGWPSGPHTWCLCNPILQISNIWFCKFWFLLSSDHRWRVYNGQCCVSVCLLPSLPDDMTYKGCPHYWPFVRRIHWWLMDCPHKMSALRTPHMMSLQSDFANLKYLILQILDFYYRVIFTEGFVMVSIIWLSVHYHASLMTSWHTKAVHITGPLWGESTVTGGFPICFCKSHWYTLCC